MGFDWASQSQLEGIRDRVLAASGRVASFGAVADVERRPVAAFFLLLVTENTSRYVLLQKLNTTTCNDTVEYMVESSANYAKKYENIVEVVSEFDEGDAQFIKEAQLVLIEKHLKFKASDSSGLTTGLTAVVGDQSSRWLLHGCQSNHQEKANLGGLSCLERIPSSLEDAVLAGVVGGTLIGVLEENPLYSQKSAFVVATSAACCFKLQFTVGEDQAICFSM
ncbi:Protein of unknown function [Gryllus bimaculatus]|nr:Protein of unknown function [Gryllus bimaculatus]